MMKNKFTPVSICLCMVSLACTSGSTIKSKDVTSDFKDSTLNRDKNAFRKLEALEWQEVFYDPCTEDWKKRWTLDGLKARISNTPEGMDFFAGPVNRENASHAVLWTKEIFESDLRIDYEYTKLDDVIEAVNIIYIQASGSGAEGFDQDISQWANKREVPMMKLYFDHMHTYHISYAAFHLPNTDPDDDYIKARRYLPDRNKKLEGTDFKPEYTRTGLFKKGVPHHITIIKKGTQLFMHIRNSEKDLLCQWQTDALPPIHKGRIGLRHMWTRGARYHNFRVTQLYTIEDN